MVWLAYLQVFVTSLRRRKRPNIFVNRISGNRDQAHLLIGNMGAEPIYVTAVIADLEADDRTGSAVISDRAGSDGTGDASPATGDSALARTRKGPLNTAEYRDAGSFREIIDLALSHIPDAFPAEEVTGLTVTVAAESTHDSYLVAGQQSFWIGHRDGQRIYVPKETYTRQIRGRRERRALSERLRAVLRDEAREALPESKWNEAGISEQ
ncbi:hypothetical protein [Palleronia rufa]|uniref:hypothetical protein n=1 Tax=Palleronia rufa TaxID=1530186 RepID=UPI001267F327|nr:hypothetical protein [Palleronia rufa]